MIAGPQLAADPRSLATLKAQASRDGTHSDATLREVARQFEAVFAQMMIKSMRATHLGDDGLGNAGQLYTSLFDQQIAQSMTKGRGLGLANMLMQQLKNRVGGPENTQAAVTALTLKSTDRIANRLAASPADGVAAPSASTAADVPAHIQSFVNRLLPHVKQAAEKLGVSARMIIAQAALETGWGSHGLGDGGHNLFGIKATGSIPATPAATTEFIDGTARNVVANFRRYMSDGESVADYARLIGNNPRYSAVAGSGDNAQRFASALQNAGYATDPDYARKLTAVAQSPDLAAALKAAAT
ncbi:MAG: flagellar assembly peptidoglycan hydrolase FlgJ [Nevskiaceae bacterium]|nr:MAG: flagellar assembly peptidoglycan hydrolase FlgJ [Nevskiaceae bacterium]TBR71562.1 MAG: flagellar assembly peptidoglycan hydrolase FlgJ [Nevskiaceae bacterium]